jgi:hypothetical protein
MELENINHLDTPALREIYKALQETGIKLFGGEMTPRTFNEICEEEIILGSFDRNPKNYVFAAQTIVDRLVEQEITSTLRHEEETYG